MKSSPTDTFENIRWRLPNGKLHREDGPAIIHLHGGVEWYLNGSRHRCDGPAQINFNKDKRWWVNGKLHREDGPACENSNGTRHWWINGKKITEQEFNNHKIKKNLEELFL